MNIYNQFHLPTETGERRKALHASVKQWLEHEDQDLTIKEILSYFTCFPVQIS
jgi:hypothetical protein